MRKGHRSSRGFSLLEMVIVMAVMTTVMAVVFQQIANLQKANRAEEMKLDLAQEGREFTDQFVRDLHQSGYPNAQLFAPGVLVSTPENDSRNAVGLVKFAFDEVWLEADVNGDGTVDSINYKLQPNSGTNQCPCKISRGWVPKDIGNATAPTSQLANTSAAYTMELQDVANSGGANGAASGAAGYTLYGNSIVGGSSQSNDSLYASYKTANVFTAYDVTGAEVPPADYSSAAGRLSLAKIRNIKINLNLLAQQGDMRTGKRPVITFATAAKVGNN